MAVKIFYDTSTNTINRYSQRTGKVADIDFSGDLPASSEGSHVIADSDLPANLDRWNADSNGLYQLITVTSDKPTITADGTDTATITADVHDASSTEDVTFTVNGGSPVTRTCSGGKATLTVKSSSPGDIVIQATSSTKYKTDSVTITAQ